MIIFRILAALLVLAACNVPDTGGTTTAITTAGESSGGGSTSTTTGSTSDAVDTTAGPAVDHVTFVLDTTGLGCDTPGGTSSATYTARAYRVCATGEEDCPNAAAVVGESYSSCPNPGSLSVEITEPGWYALEVTTVSDVDGMQYMQGHCYEVGVGMNVAYQVAGEVTDIDILLNESFALEDPISVIGMGYITCYTYCRNLPPYECRG